MGFRYLLSPVKGLARQHYGEPWRACRIGWMIAHAAGIIAHGRCGKPLASKFDVARFFIVPHPDFQPDGFVGHTASMLFR
jgi:hypothetical protein